jgi:hypothetical protein
VFFFHPSHHHQPRLHERNKTAKLFLVSASLLHLYRYHPLLLLASTNRVNLMMATEREKKAVTVEQQVAAEEDNGITLTSFDFPSPERRVDKFLSSSFNLVAICNHRGVTASNVGGVLRIPKK